MFYGALLCGQDLLSKQGIYPKKGEGMPLQVGRIKQASFSFNDQRF